MKSAQSLSFRPCKFWVLEDIGDMNNPPLQQGSSNDGSALRFDRDGSDVFDVFGREPKGLSAKEHSALLPGYRGVIRVAKAGSRFDERLQHRLEIKRRATNDLQHVGRGGLLLQRLAQV